MTMKKMMALLITVTLIVGIMPLNALALETDPAVAEEGTEQTDESGTEVPTETMSEEQTTVTVEKQYVSATNNMIGGVFIKMLNESSSSDGAKTAEELFNLTEYPWDHHDLSYYGNSPRVRYLGNANDPNANYLVYRDTFLIFSEADSNNYTISFSADGKTAYITPSIPAADLSGKTGIVFLADNIGNDRILVFNGTPTESGGQLVVPLADENDITFNQLFSDGKIGVKAVSGLPGIDWESDFSGTNWSGKITDKSVNDISASLDFDVFSGFEINFNFDFDIDFDITTTGATGKRESAKIAKITIPIDIFTAIYTFNIVAEFDDAPMNVKGNLHTDFNYGLTVNGANINDYNSPVTISELTFTNAEDYNKDVSFYIGSELISQLAIIYVEIDLGIIKIEFGPVLSLDFHSYGGRYFTVNFAKDAYDKPDASASQIHVCAQSGKDGCLHLNYAESQGFDISATINLYVKKIPINFYSDEEIIDTGEQYNSYTFGDGWQDGACPHTGYRIDVTVDNNLKMSTEGATVSYTPVKEHFDPFDFGVVDGSNKTILFAPANDQIQVTAVLTSPHDSTWQISQTLTLDKNADVQALNFMLEVPQKHVYFKNSETGTAEGWPKDIDFAPFYSEYVKVPNSIPTLSGRQFIGWNTAEDGSGKFYAPGTVFALDDDLTLYAQWDKAESSWYVIYNANGGKSAPGPQIVPQGNNDVLTSDLPSGGTLKFLGWALDENASAPDYQPGETLPYDSTKNVVVLYALWEIDPAQRPVIVSFDANGGHADSLPKNISIPLNTWAHLPDKIPAWDLSHQFLGWSDDPNATEAKWEPGSVVFFTEDKTLYAVWKELPTPQPSPTPEPPPVIPVPSSGETLSMYPLAGLILLAMGGTVFFLRKRLFSGK